MAATNHESFDPAAEQFLDTYDQVRGFIRQELVRYNLLGYLSREQPLEVLDFGGGDGRDAFWAATLGHHITVIDSSGDMLDKAHAKAEESENRSVASQVELLHGTLDDVPAAGTFDVVLSHGVLMYELEEPQHQLNTLAHALKPRGIFSLLTKGHNAAAALMAERADQTAYIPFEDHGRFTNRLGRTAIAYDFRQLYKMLTTAGLAVQESFGVRVLHDDDHRPVAGVSPWERVEILMAEHEAGQDAVQKHDAQMLHVIAAKL